MYIQNQEGSVPKKKKVQLQEGCLYLLSSMKLLDSGVILSQLRKKSQNLLKTMS